MKVQPFWGIMLIIGIVWISNYMYAYSQKLDQPVFLNHYIDYHLSEEQYTPFYFLTNKEDSSFIQVVEVGDIRGYPDRFGEHNGIETIEQFGRYSLKRVMIRFDEEAVDTLTEPVRFDKMNVYFSEQSETIYPIGQIVFHPLREEYRPFTTSSVSGGNHTESRLTVDEELVIDSVNTSFDELLDERLMIKLSSASLNKEKSNKVLSSNEEWNQTKGIDRRDVELPLVLDKGDYLTVKSYAEPSLHAVLMIAIEIKGTTKAGAPFTAKEGYVQFEPSINKQQVERLIKQRTEADANE
ncbi:hypothetical protein DV702_14510 [Sporosarcina sp. PTS2304]|uniref:hypothetical protein n=1 Tax=Sporosarcina sp. PTS2304 TaxID=2283194 RepID=UPI000E0CC236|nr:hypothetical protein [Sporosarcina sp. PTS2304]AXI00811.1 hypothetical protein DV702_14510 [Sporosarcina sp. PTS2304]